MDRNENDVPDDIKQTLDPLVKVKDIKQKLGDTIFTVRLVDGRYPLFDWDRISPKTLEVVRRFAPFANSLADIVNPNKYVVIDAFDDPDVYSN